MLLKGRRLVQIDIFFQKATGKALLTSNCRMGHPLAKATVRTTRMVVGLTVGRKVSGNFETGLLVEAFGS